MTNGLTPIFSDVICELKENMNKGGGSAYLMASYIFGGVWQRAQKNIYSGTKSDLANELCIDIKTLDKYLSMLVDLGYLEQSENSSVYIIGRTARFQLTVSALRPTVDNSQMNREHVPEQTDWEHVPVNGSMYRNFREHVPSAHPMINHDNIDINNGTIEQIREMWRVIELDHSGKSFKNTIELWLNELDELAVLTAAWVDQWLNAPNERLEPGQYVYRFQKAIYPTTPKTKTWFNQDDLALFAVSEQMGADDYDE